MTDIGEVVLDQNFLECPVCLELFDDTCKMLPCQHTFHKRCLQKILSVEDRLACPQCRKLVTEDIESLPRNYFLLSVLDKAKTKPLESEEEALRLQFVAGQSKSEAEVKAREEYLQSQKEKLEQELMLLKWAKKSSVDDVEPTLQNASTSSGAGPIWQGIVEWQKRGSSIQQVQCHVTDNYRNDKEFDIYRKAENWPQKLSMQLIPKQLISNVGNAYLKNSATVIFKISPGESTEALLKDMSSGYAGHIQFNNTSGAVNDFKVLVLLYTPDKKVFLGFIPKNQHGFVERLHTLIQEREPFSMQRLQTQALNTTYSQTGTSSGAMQNQLFNFESGITQPSSNFGQGPSTTPSTSSQTGIPSFHFGCGLTQSGSTEGQLNSQPNHTSGIFGNMTPFPATTTSVPNQPVMMDLGTADAFSRLEQSTASLTDMGQQLEWQDNLANWEPLEMQLDVAQQQEVRYRQMQDELQKNLSEQLSELEKKNKDLQTTNKLLEEQNARLQMGATTTASQATLTLPSFTAPNAGTLASGSTNSNQYQIIRTAAGHTYVTKGGVTPDFLKMIATNEKRLPAGPTRRYQIPGLQTASGNAATTNASAQPGGPIRRNQLQVLQTPAGTIVTPARTISTLPSGPICRNQPRVLQIPARTITLPSGPICGNQPQGLQTAAGNVDTTNEDTMSRGSIRRHPPQVHQTAAGNVATTNTGTMPAGPVRRHPPQVLPTAVGNVAITNTGTMPAGPVRRHPPQVLPTAVGNVATTNTGTTPVGPVRTHPPQVVPTVAGNVATTSAVTAVSGSVHSHRLRGLQMAAGNAASVPVNSATESAENVGRYFKVGSTGQSSEKMTE